MHKLFKGRLPWALTFSFARAIQQPALEAWNGKDENIKKAQQILHFRAGLDSAARRGEYTADMEKDNK
jgi:fructose-bisphosphate aldolase class I